ncbi:MAG: PLP-dependent transferase, partial [Gemmatimonadota bacterium]
MGREIAGRVRQNTRAVFMESPGSFTFEVQDVPAIVGAVRDAERARGSPIYTLIDNAWGSPGLFTPL